MLQISLLVARKCILGLVGVSLLVLSACAGGGGDGDGEADVAEPVATTEPLSLGDTLRAEPGNRSGSAIASVINDAEYPFSGERGRGFYPRDYGDLDLGDPQSPCTPAQRLKAGEFEPEADDTQVWRLDDESARVGMQILWFATAEEAATYIGAYAETCTSYDTYNSGGTGSARGIERTLELADVDGVDERIDTPYVLTTSWRATLNGLGWGDDILHAGQVDRFVLESVMRFNGPIEDRRAEANANFDALVAAFLTAYES